jgi:NTE family protein
MRRALVLGGGGITGLAWEAGLVAGLTESGVNLGAASDVIGTSAGSVVGSWITSGRDLAQAAASQREDSPVQDGSEDAPDAGRIMRAFGRWSAIGCYSLDDGREVGAIAREIGSERQPRWIEAIGQQLGTQSWPAALRVSAVDTHSGAVSIMDAGSGVALSRAVAASCAVPGIFPTVDIDGRNYMDGAIPTGTHAHRALERSAQSVLIVAAFDERTPGIGCLMRRELDSEAARLRDAGARVAVITPSARAGEIVKNAMDPSLRAAAVEAGLEQGRAEASVLEDWQR